MLIAEQGWNTHEGFLDALPHKGAATHASKGVCNMRNECTQLSALCQRVAAVPTDQEVCAGRCVVIEDSRIGQRAAHDAGMRCVVTKSRYTEDEDFDVADAVFDCIGDAGDERFSLHDLTTPGDQLGFALAGLLMAERPCRHANSVHGVSVGLHAWRWACMLMTGCCCREPLGEHASTGRGGELDAMVFAREWSEP